MAIDKKTGRELPTGIINHQGGYLARYQYKGELYQLSDKDLKRLMEKFADLKYEVRHGKYKKPTALIFSDWFATWLETHRTHEDIKPRENSLDQYRNAYKMHISDSFKKKRLSKITSEDVLALFDKMVKKDYAYNTIKAFRNMLSGVFTDAVEKEHIPVNPVHKAKIPKKPDAGEQRTLDVDEAVMFLKYAMGTELYYFFVVALETGMRCGELRALQWCNVDFKNRYIHVRHTLNYKNRQYQLGPTKSDSSTRNIPMTDKVYAYLQEWKEIQQSFIFECGDYWNPDAGFEDLVFTMQSGRPLSQTKVRDEIKKIVGRINNDGFKMAHITPHAFRHTFATRCLERGVTPKVLQKYLGHKKLDTTMETYTHVLERLSKREIEKINGWEKDATVETGETDTKLADIISITDVYGSYGKRPRYN